MIVKLKELEFWNMTICGGGFTTILALWRYPLYFSDWKSIYIVSGCKIIWVSFNKNKKRDDLLILRAFSGSGTNFLKNYVIPYIICKYKNKCVNRIFLYTWQNSNHCSDMMHWTVHHIWTSDPIDQFLGPIVTAIRYKGISMRAHLSCVDPADCLPAEQSHRPPVNSLWCLAQVQHPEVGPAPDSLDLWCCPALDCSHPGFYSGV